MSKLFFDGAISLDGFWAGDNRGPKNPIGDNGRSNHQWMYKQKAFWKYLGMEGGSAEGFENDMVQQSIDRTGAFIMGKRIFEEGEVHWPEDLYKFPVFVLTHEKRQPWVQKGTTTFYFINDGIHRALEKAREAARDKDIRVQGGANVIQQYLNAGLVDEFIVHTAPVVLGSGIRLFDGVDRKNFKVEIADVRQGELAIHTSYRVINKNNKEMHQEESVTSEIDRIVKDRIQHSAPTGLEKR
jgi:dihydrofolate reductase